VRISHDPESTRTQQAAGRVLLTGATGYIGGRLLRKLEESGQLVRCMVRRPEALSGRRGRRDPIRLAVGDTLDFWRVEAFGQDRLLRLRAEMKAPGRIWLQFEVDGDQGRATLCQTAIFDPHGLAGLAYWYALYPVHHLIFEGMLRRIGQAAMAGGEAQSPDASTQASWLARGLATAKGVMAPRLRSSRAYIPGTASVGLLDGRAQMTPEAIAALLGHGARAVAAGRVVLGLTALAWPSVPARPWVGAASDDLAARVFGRALGARDIALGLGALTALRGRAAERESACAWVAAGALSDALDVVASLSSWRELPQRGRWLVIASASGAALTGAAGALAVRPDRNGASS
jgi:Protein of unknown function (DUF2867)